MAWTGLLVSLMFFLFLVFDDSPFQMRLTKFGVSDFFFCKKRKEKKTKEAGDVRASGILFWLHFLICFIRFFY